MKILIVEDDTELCLALKRVLAHTNHVTKCVDKMAKCPRAIVDFQPQAIILDLGLPDSQGLETLEAMFGLVDHTVPVIVFTGQPLLASSCLELGAVEYLVKGSFSTVDIPRVLEQAVARHKLSTALDRHQRAAAGEASWPGPPVKDPGDVGDRLVSLAGEIRSLASGG